MKWDVTELERRNVVEPGTYYALTVYDLVPSVPSVRPSDKKNIKKGRERKKGALAFALLCAL